MVVKGGSCGSRCCDGLCGQYVLRTHQVSEANTDHDDDRVEVPTECTLVIGKSTSGIHAVQREASPSDQFYSIPVTQDSSEALDLGEELYLDGDEEAKQEYISHRSKVWTSFDSVQTVSSQRSSSPQKVKADATSNKKGIRRMAHMYAAFIQSRRESLQLRRMRSGPWPGANR